MATQAQNREFGLPEAKRLPTQVGSLLGLIVPWSVAVAAGMVAAVRRRGDDANYARWLLLWVVVGLLPFLFMKAFERYTLALVCPMALLATWWLEQQQPKTARVHATIATVLIGIPTAVFALFLIWFGLGYLLPLLALGLLYVTWRTARREVPDLPRCALLTATALSLLLGAIYPLIGINRLPDELPADISTANVVTFGRAQPGMLSIRLDRSVPEMDGRDEGLADRLAGYRGYLFVLDSDVERVERAAQSRELPLERVLEFSSFYSRKAWLKFFRQGARWPDWQRALTSRSPEPLMPRFVCLRRS